MRKAKGSVEEWDVLVVGAGPAGAKAAELAVDGGASVLLVEKRARIGVPVQCAEFLHRRVATQLAVPSKAIAQWTTEMVTHIHGDNDVRTKAPGCMLHRDRFDAFLVERAVKAGAELRRATLVVGPYSVGPKDDHPVGAVMESALDVKRKYVKAKVLIGADGPLSTVGDWVDRRNDEVLHAHQMTVRIREPLSATEVFLHPDYPGGYGWLFPKGKVANVGVGVDRRLGGKPKDALMKLLISLKDRIGPTVSRTSGLVPVGGPLRTVLGRVLLVGDAGGFTHPITGGGIHQAVETGRMAGDAAARFISGEEGALGGFESKWKGLLGRSLEHAAGRRREMALGWRAAASDPKRFEALMKRCWVAFKEYNSP